MFKFLAVFVILAVAVGAYPAPEEVPVEAPKALSSDGQTDLATTSVQADLEGSEASDGSDLKGSETFGFGYYPIGIGYGRGYGYGGYGGYGYGGYGGGWGYGGGYGGWGGYRRRGWGGYW